VMVAGVERTPCRRPFRPQCQWRAARPVL